MPKGGSTKAKAKAKKKTEKSTISLNGIAMRKVVLKEKFHTKDSPEKFSKLHTLECKSGKAIHCGSISGNFSNNSIAISSTSSHSRLSINDLLKPCLYYI